jgi:hypothetical protein
MTLSHTHTRTKTSQSMQSGICASKLALVTQFHCPTTRWLP